MVSTSLLLLAISCALHIIQAVNARSISVCGSDGNNCDTIGDLRLARLQNPYLRVSHTGYYRQEFPDYSTYPEELDSKVGTECPLTKDPVCGTDGMTYGNKCFLYFEKTKNRNLKVKHKGECNGNHKIESLKYKPKPRDCELTMNPVCGSDGKSYGSECFLNVNKEYDPKLHVAYKGWCKQKLGTPKICPLVYAPVCGTDGETYSNSCFLKAQKKLDPSLQIKHSGECNDLKPSTPRKKLETFTVCTLEYDPVCGTDGETYANSCSFRAQKKLDPSLQIKHSGKCNDLKPSTPRKKLETFTICTLEYDPVCGTDGKTYGNSCFFRAQKKLDPSLQIKHSGECNDLKPSTPRKKLETFTVCTLEYDPMCGTDGETYDNSCAFRAQKKLDPSLQINHLGECNDLKPSTPRKKLETFTICTLEYDPVCGTDGKTYGNSCFFRAQKKLDPSLQIKHSGECNDIKRSTPRKKWDGMGLAETNCYCH